MHFYTRLCIAQLIMRFLDDNDVRVLYWLGNGPDMNSIETFRAIVTSRLQVVKITTKTDLISIIIKVWHREISLPKSH